MGRSAREYQDSIPNSYIGRVLEREGKGNIEVVGFLPKTGQNKRLYLCTCSVCHKDKELWPYPIEATKRAINNGTNICGCGKPYCYSPYQYKVKIRRKLEGTTVKVMSYWDKKSFKGNQTRIMLVCTKHKRIYSSSVINLLDSEINCKLCSGEIVGANYRTSDEERSEIFQKKYPQKGIKIHTIKENNKNKVYMSCSVCSGDEYALAGCSSLFYLSPNALTDVKIRCRCTSNYRWTEEERLHQIQRRLDSIGGTFIGWTEVYTNYKSKFKWLCNKGHPCETSVDKFINRLNGCKTCVNLERKISWSYQPEYKERQDNLYIIQLYDDSESFIKVGRSFNTNRRFGEYRCKYNLDTIGIYTGSYEDVWEVECGIHTHLWQKYHYFPTKQTSGFQRECYKLSVLEDNMILTLSDHPRLKEVEHEI